MKELCSVKDNKYRVKCLLNKLLLRSKEPIHNAKAYDNKQLRVIDTLYDEYFLQTIVMNIATLTYEIRQASNERKMLNNHFIPYIILNRICENTDAKVTNLFALYRKIHNKKKEQKRILLRDFKRQELGYCQFDLKTFTIGEYNISQRMYFVDLIDKASCFVYSEPVLKPSTAEIIRIFQNGYAYFKKYGIKIERIQADHCNIFTPSAGMKHQEFINCLTE